MQAVWQHDDQDDGWRDAGQEIYVLAKIEHAPAQPGDGDDGRDCRDDHQVDPA